MRIAIDETSIIEVTTIDLTPAWDNGNPDGPATDLFIFIVRAGDESGDYIGKYNLDGTEETYLKAIENYKKIFKKLLEKGYCKFSDFENFELY